MVSRKAIFFDLDDTLVDRRLTAQRYSELFIRDFEDRLIERDIAHISETIWHADQGGHSPTREHDLIRWLQWRNAPSELELADHWRELFPCSSIARVDARRALMTLRRDGIAVGVVTNGPIARQRLKLRITGLWSYVDAFMTSEMINISKPSAAIFKAACDIAGVQPSDSVFIGDHPEIDVIGAAAAGMRSVWLHSWGDGWPAGLGPLPPHARTLSGTISIARRLIGCTQEMTILVVHADDDPFYTETVPRLMRESGALEVRVTALSDIAAEMPFPDAGLVLVDGAKSLAIVRDLHASVPIVVVRPGDSDPRLALALFRYDSRAAIELPATRNDHQAQVAALCAAIRQLVGSHVSPSRWFKNTSGTIQKSGSIRRTAVRDQIAFLQYVQSAKPRAAELLPAVRSTTSTRSRAVYEMPLYPATSLRDVLLRHPGQWSCRALTRSVLVSVIESAFDRIYSENIRLDVPPSFIRDALFGRFAKRTATTRAILNRDDLPGPRQITRLFRAIFSADEIEIGGRRHLNPARIIQEIAALPEWRERITPPFLAMVHGDLHFDNILVISSEPMELKLVDPRGGGLVPFPPGTGDVARDIGKLLHSGHGEYDLIHAGCIGVDWHGARVSPRGHVSIPALAFQEWITEERHGGASGARITVTQRGPEEWRRSISHELGDLIVEEVGKQDKFTATDSAWLCRARLYEALQFCTVAPFHLEDDPRRSLTFHLRGIELMNDYYALYGPLFSP